VYLGICHRREFLNSVCVIGYSIVFGYLFRFWNALLFYDFELYHQFQNFVAHFFFLSALFRKGLLIWYFCHGGASIVNCSFHRDFDHAQRQCHCKNKRVHFAPTISSVHTIYQSKQEVQDKGATYACVSILMYFSECQ
jgi:hypothetical protein